MIDAGGYSLVGQVRYEAVEGRGYLEMWSVFADGSRYFSRSLAAAGPTAALTGTSSWRAFALPFALNGGAAPVRLEVNLVLPGQGAVWIGPMQLEGLVGVADAGSVWWNDRTAGAVGGIGGSLLGVLGAGLGILMARGRGRVFVIGVLWGLRVVGSAGLVVGAVAVASSQPYAVWYPVTLSGGLCLALGLVLMPVARRRYAETELRRIRAIDLGPSRTSSDR
jgi:hypothetical protein